MAKKVIIKNASGDQILPYTLNELVLDTDGVEALSRKLSVYPFAGTLATAPTLESTGLSTVPDEIYYVTATGRFVGKTSLKYYNVWTGTSLFPLGDNGTTGYLPEENTFYQDTTTGKVYRGTTSGLVEVIFALGETSSTAYRGDRGAAAYKHAVTNKGKELSSGFYKITTNSEGHVTAGTAVTKSDIITICPEISTAVQSVTVNGTEKKSGTTVALGAAADYGATTSVAKDSTALVTSGGVFRYVSSQMSGVTGVLVYKGTIGTGGTITTLPTASSSNKGWVYMVATAGTYVGANEVGDMLISNGSSWQAINGENQVSNGAKTITPGATAVTIATVDGTNITLAVAKDTSKQDKLTNPVTAASAFTAADMIVTTNAASGTVVKQSSYSVVSSISDNQATGAIPTASAVASYVTGKGYKTTDVSCTESGHYTPSTASSTKSASGATGTAGATVQVVTGIKIDSKGHVISVVSGAATDTKTTVDSSLSTSSTNPVQNKIVTNALNTKLTYEEIGTVTDLTVA